MARSKSTTWARALAGLLLLAGCGGGSEPELGARSGLACVDDSLDCITKRQASLRHLVADSNRSWVNEPATPESYASGVRLFAFKTKKKEMSCAELARGHREADAAPGVLRGTGGARLTPAQVSRGVMLAAEVGRELGTEMGRRCRKG